MSKYNYSHWVGVRKAVIQGLVFGIPLLLQILPAEWANLTLGAVISYGLNYLKYNLK